MSICHLSGRVGLLVVLILGLIPLPAIGAIIEGVVTDSETGGPLIGVTMRMREFGLETRTDSSGYYRIILDTVGSAFLDCDCGVMYLGPSIGPSPWGAVDERLDFALDRSEHWKPSVPWSERCSYSIGASIEGQVRDKDTDRPIGGVSVSRKDYDSVYTTDEFGYYCMSGIYADACTLQVSKIGYEDSEDDFGLLTADVSHVLKFEMCRDYSSLAVSQQVLYDSGYALGMDEAEEDIAANRARTRKLETFDGYAGIHEETGLMVELINDCGFGVGGGRVDGYNSRIADYLIAAQEPKYSRKQWLSDLLNLRDYFEARAVSEEPIPLAGEPHNPDLKRGSLTLGCYVTDGPTLDFTEHVSSHHIVCSSLGLNLWSGDHDCERIVFFWGPEGSDVLMIKSDSTYIGVDLRVRKQYKVERYDAYGSYPYVPQTSLTWPEDKMPGQ